LRAVTDWGGVSGAWLDLLCTTATVGVVMGLVMLLLRTPELTEALPARVLGRLTRNYRSVNSEKP
jgi:hypothetical protein